MERSLDNRYIFLERISNHLIVNASSLNDLGLYHGKIGVCLFFAHYSRFTGCTLYDDFASELMDEVYKDIHNGLSLNFENGYCGVGWAIQYLIENKFMAGNPIRILAGIDNKIMDWDLSRITDMSEKTGLQGISYYIDNHIQYSLEHTGSLPFDNRYIREWKRSIAAIELKKKNLISIYKTFDIAQPVKQWELGLENGCAGYGLKLMNI